MKLFEVTLQNGACLKVQADDYEINTTEKGTLTHVEFIKRRELPNSGQVGEVILAVSGTTFSHLEIVKGE